MAVPSGTLPRRPRNPSPIPTNSFPDCQRAHGRVVLEAVRCSLGDALDASAAGMRIRAVRRPSFDKHDVVCFTVQGCDGPFPVKGEVMWVKHRGWRWNEFGLRFVDVTADTRRHLNALAQSAAGNTTYSTSIRLREQG
ncbi:MAG TPA: hypothetical protein DEB06_06825 [Phycisphaerales bacterium]|nr:hypothetical protein [Phycisphaerales bacterium]